ncbi:MAG: HlyD family efflux transporter periplasmic adaptor subunit, partial [Nitrospirota bacterium]
MTRTRIGWSLVLIVLIAAGALMWNTFRPSAKEAAWRPVQVARGDLQVTVLATGVAQPQNRVEIRPPVAGRADEILVREGQPVKQGQILAWLSSTERAVLLDAARAKGPEELAHWENLYKPTPLIAPLDGVIIARKVEPGQTVTAQDAVLVISNRLIVKAQVDETDIAQVQIGQRAAITLDAYPDRPIQGRVVHITYEAKTVNNVTVYEVDVLPDHVPDIMRSGMTANVSFHTARREHALLLPAEAVRQEEGGAAVWVPNPADAQRPASKPVEIGASEAGMVEILAG